MAISFGAAGAKAFAAGTPTNIAYPTGVSAGHLAITTRIGWNASQVTFATESGWTSRVLNLAGGTGTGIGNHTTIMACDTLELAGTESGSVAFDWTDSGGDAGGMMVRYAKDVSETWDIASATGDDNTHGANRSATSTTNLDLDAGDYLLALVGIDVNAALTVSGESFSASGITFGTITRRTNSGGSALGNDGNLELWDVPVSSGSGNVAVTFSFTTATSQCGPVIFLRLRTTGGTPALPPILVMPPRTY